METMDKKAVHQTPAEFTEQFINQTNKSVFLTGKAGTGKTTLLKKVIEATHKNTVVVAPTGIAALNAGGVTIHSFFQLPFGGFIPTKEQPPIVSERSKVESQATLTRHFRMNSRRKSMLRNLELLIIDEVSMLRADLLDAIDFTLRTVRKNSQPFGGVQILYIGDLLQLPPIVKNDEWQILQQYYRGAFFFNAHVIQQDQPLYIELDKIFRQSDGEFIQILNHLRNNYISDEDVKILNQYVQPDFDATKHEGYITLTTHNAKADNMNADALKAIDEESHKYYAEVTGNFPEHIYPIEEQLELKVGAQVMFIKNDISPDKQFYNGKMGKIVELSDDEVKVHFPEESLTIEVEKYEWENIKYSVDEASGEIKEEVQGTFVHYPLKLAWAITVHKSQGLTFDKAVLDLSRVFAPGQAYVALSRLRSLKGLVLLNPMQLRGLKNDQQVVAYAENKAQLEELDDVLNSETINYIKNRLRSAFNWEIMASQWLALEKNHLEAGARSEIGKNKDQFLEQMNAIMTTLEPARKFRGQLQRICHEANFNLNHVVERFEAAYDYFMKTLEPIFQQNIKQMLQLGMKRGAKYYLEELEKLDEGLTETLLELKRAKNLMMLLKHQQPITKENIWSPEVKNYKLTQVSLMKNEVRNDNPALLDEEAAEAIVFKKSKKKKAKKSKKSTYETTLDMFKAGQDVGAIAEERQLTKNTIYNHLARLVQNEKIEITEVLSKERVLALQQIIGDTMERGLKEYKDELGDAVTYAELKLYRASLLK